jgi:hypothetical protein
MDIGKETRRVTVVPLKREIKGPEPVSKPIPQKTVQPVKIPEKV